MIHTITIIQILFTKIAIDIKIITLQIITQINHFICNTLNLSHLLNETHPLQDLRVDLTRMNIPTIRWHKVKYDGW